MQTRSLDDEMHVRIEQLLRSLVNGQLSVNEYTEMRSQLVQQFEWLRSHPEAGPLPSVTPPTNPDRPWKRIETPAPGPLPRHCSVAPTVEVERVLGLNGTVHHNPYMPGPHFNRAHQQILKRNSPRLARALHSAALGRHDEAGTPPQPDHFHNPWLYGRHYSLARQHEIEHANPMLALKLQAECRRLGQD
jgi:hypothetical protein